MFLVEFATLTMILCKITIRTIVRKVLKLMNAFFLFRYRCIRFFYTHVSIWFKRKKEWMKWNTRRNVIKRTDRSIDINKKKEKQQNKAHSTHEQLSE